MLNKRWITCTLEAQDKFLLIIQRGITLIEVGSKKVAMLYKFHLYVW